MAGPHHGVVWKGKEDSGNRVVELRRIAILEIRSPGSSNEEGITGKDVVANTEAQGIIGVAWRRDAFAPRR